MKRTILTATAAIALMTAPAVAQIVDGDVGVTTDTEITTDVPETAVETGSDITTSVRTEADTMKDHGQHMKDHAEHKADWAKDQSAEVDVDTEAETGVGGEFYENEADAAADADLGAEVEVETRSETYGDYVADEMPEGTEVEIETDLGADGEGGVYYENEASASADADLNSGADVEVETPAYGAPSVNVETPSGNEIDVETSEDGVGGPMVTNRNEAIARLSNLDTVPNEISSEVEALDTDGLNAYVLNSMRADGMAAGNDVTVTTDTELEADGEW